MLKVTKAHVTCQQCGKPRNLSMFLIKKVPAQLVQGQKREIQIQPTFLAEMSVIRSNCGHGGPIPLPGRCPRDMVCHVLMTFQMGQTGRNPGMIHTLDQDSRKERLKMERNNKVQHTKGQQRNRQIIIHLLGAGAVQKLLASYTTVTCH